MSESGSGGKTFSKKGSQQSLSTDHPPLKETGENKQKTQQFKIPKQSIRPVTQMSKPSDMGGGVKKPLLKKPLQIPNTRSKFNNR